MADIFNEVDDELRSARLTAVFQRWWRVALGVLVLALVIALAVWAWRGWERSQDAKSSEAYARGVEALAAGKLDDADKAFGQAAAQGSSGARALALMQQAGVRMNRNQSGPAAELLDRAARISHDPLVSDAAALEAAFARMDVVPLDQTQARLQPLLGAGRPYRDMAREGLALAKLGAGRTAEARADLATLQIQPDVSEGARNRARAAVAMIDSGATSTLAAGVKAELAMPPAPMGVSAAALAARSETQ